MTVRSTVFVFVLATLIATSGTTYAVSDADVSSDSAPDANAPERASPSPADHSEGGADSTVGEPTQPDEPAPEHSEETNRGGQDAPAYEDDPSESLDDSPQDPTNPVEDPDEPTDPIDDPEAPTDPVEEPEAPTEPVEEPEEPTDPVDDPNEPVEEPDEPVDEPDEPTDPVEDPTEPTDPVEEPEEPSDPGDSTGSPAIDFTIDQIENCGLSCRDATATVTNDGNGDATGVVVETAVFTDGKLIFEGSFDVGTVAAGDSVTQTQRIDISFGDALDVQNNGGIVTIETTVVHDGGSADFSTERDVV